MPDLILKCFGHSQLWLLWPACSQNRPDSTSHICFSSVFQRWHGSYCAKLTRIWPGWPGQGLARRIWSRSNWTVVQESSGLVSGRTQPPCYQFPTFGLRWMSVFLLLVFFLGGLAGLFVCALAGTILLSNINYDAKLCLPAMLLYNT